eukprot:CAMPEP_0206208818 /NCGR_PEP_ID=MMETSP0166-20121206/16514_1 /ASSEMBLY_ACC=CAM_ASM_000260 /TAXON_ID=95228 /ORGANISM="Vannella robusta, Strain DIVA3 518/3/11/1/6" /LENGTH=164 /DNA_ID=CAMNT_0053630045 /DNA_START=109 /DNA_END=600 /DNA_ORIENTATION=+
MLHEAPIIEDIYHADLLASEERIPKYRSHLYPWGHHEQIMSVIENPREYKYNRQQIVALCEERGFLPALFYFYRGDKNFFDAMKLALHSDDIATFEELASSLPSLQWSEIVREWMKMDREDHQRSISSELIMSLILQTLGATDALQLLEDCEEFAAALPMRVTW